MNLVKRCALFIGAFIILASCKQEAKVDLNQMKGSFVVLRVNIDGFEEKTARGFLTKRDEVERTIHKEDLGDDLIMETSIEEVISAPKTKLGATNNMDPSSKILAIVYN